MFSQRKLKERKCNWTHDDFAHFSNWNVFCKNLSIPWNYRFYGLKFVQHEKKNSKIWNFHCEFENMKFDIILSKVTFLQYHTNIYFYSFSSLQCLFVFWWFCAYCLSYLNIFVFFLVVMMMTNQYHLRFLFPKIFFSLLIP